MKGVVLLSGGIDSPVAYYIMKKKMDCIAIHFVMNGKEKIEAIMRLLHGKIYFVSYEMIKEEILKVKESYRCIICKRFMYGVAEEIAKIEDANIIITGENIGQVASQTLDNIKAIEKVVGMPVVRPLIAMDKEEIVNVAKKIGTYEISITQNYRCSMVPKKPITKARVERVEKEEEKIEKNVIKKAVKNAIIEKF